jgi:hypothetical protein
MLTPEDQALLEATLLPALERHFLSLLAHGLRTFQAIAATTDQLIDQPTDQPTGQPKRLPERLQIEAWAASQASLADDPGFREAFVEQLCRLRDPLGEIAARGGQSPLDLPIEALVAWVREQADGRLSRPASPPPAAEPIPPPG